MQLYVYDLIEKKRQVTEAKFKNYFMKHGTERKQKKVMQIMKNYKFEENQDDK
jgi:hypothetical protein